MIHALSNIHHDGTLYTEGQEIPGLTDEQAAALIAAGAAETAPEQKPAKPSKPTGGAD
jgi:hypothetical protein